MNDEIMKNIKKIKKKILNIRKEKRVGVGGKRDGSLTLIRMGLFFGDPVMCKKYLDIAYAELEKGDYHIII